MRKINGSKLWEAFQDRVERHPNNVAIVSLDSQQTFADVSAMADGILSALTSFGVAAGDVVHVALPNVPGFLPSVLALCKAGVTVGLVSSRYRDAEFRALAARIPPKAYLTTSALAAVLGRSLDVRERRAITLNGMASDLELVFPVAPPITAEALRGERSNLAVIKFTSGSTGAPKGVGLSEENVLAEGQNVVGTLGITSSDRIVVPVPLSHSYGFDLGLLPVILAGAKSVLRRSFIPREILTDLANSETSLFLGVPSMYRILAATDNADIPSLAHIRYLLSCTAPLLPDLVALCRDRLGVSVCQHYGSSESGAIATHRPNDVLRYPNSVGLPMANVHVFVVGPSGDALGTGQEGEIVVRSSAVSAGYVTDELPSSQEVFRRINDSVTEYRTGDIGTLNEEGYIFWRGRRDAVINVGGLKVYPSEVVQVLERCPAVSGARVVAAKDQSGEEIVHAVVTLSQSMREQDILEFCRQHLADYKVPRRIAIVDAISTPDAAKMSDLSGDV